MSLELIEDTSQEIWMTYWVSSVPVTAVAAEGVSDGLDQTDPPEKLLQ